MHVILCGDVAESMMENLMKNTCRIQQKQDITIHLCTSGGDFYVALGIYDYIRALKNHVTVVCEGPVMSAGITILQAADERIARPNSYLMIHYGNDGQTTRNERMHNVKLDKLHQDIITAKTVNVGANTIKRWFNEDTYLTANQALKYGLIDSIKGEEK